MHNINMVRDIFMTIYKLFKFIILLIFSHLISITKIKRAMLAPGRPMKVTCCSAALLACACCSCPVASCCLHVAACLCLLLACSACVLRYMLALAVRMLSSRGARCVPATTRNNSCNNKEHHKHIYCNKEQ
jgi:hypothetical protein